MAVKKESVLTRNIIKALKKEIGGYWFKVHGSAYQQAGLPDIMGCVQGHFIGLEVKVPGREKTLTKLQKQALSDINENGGYAGVVTSVKGALTQVYDWCDNKGLPTQTSR